MVIILQMVIKRIMIIIMELSILMKQLDFKQPVLKQLELKLIFMLVCFQLILLIQEQMVFLLGLTLTFI